MDMRHRIVILCAAMLTSAVLLCGAALAWEHANVPPDTSRQAITPQWAFGVWMWEDDVNTRAAIYDIVNGCARHDLPLNAVIVDSPWETAYNNFEWDRVRYPDPQRMIRDCHARGVRVIMWMTPLINVVGKQADARGATFDLYAFAKGKGYLANGGKTIKWWKGEGGFVDYTNPEAVEWWHGLMDRVLLMGTDGWKVDGAAERFPWYGGYGKGGPIKVMEYVDMYYRDTYNHLLHRNPSGVTMVRSVDIGESGYTGRHAPLDAAPITWFGDQEHRWDKNGLADAIQDQFLAMAKGYSVMGTDIAGYDRAHDAVIPRSLYLRWLQWSTFLPFFLNGGHDEHRPWKYDREFFDIYRRFAWTHQELAPYWYSLVRERHDGGPPAMKAGPGTWEYIIGDQFLVAIMDKDETKRAVTFPEGDWIDYFDNTAAHHGPSQAEIPVPMNRYPVFIRSGSIIPLDVASGYAGHGDESSAGAMTLDIYPDPERPAAFPLWDEKLGKTDIACAVKAGVTSVTLSGGAAREYVLRVMAPKPLKQVRLVAAANVTVLEELDRGRWEAQSGGWRYDAADKRLWVRLRAEGKATIEVE
jgi:alpha-glucosidase (family GH31 glycosyl hydrolase)